MSNGSYVEYTAALLKFLRTKSTYEKEDVTHTLVGIPSGKFCIKTREDKDKLFELYSRIFSDHSEDSETDEPTKICLDAMINLSEKQRVVGPLMTDYDFEFVPEQTQRKYTIDNIKYVVEKLNKLIHEYIDIDDDEIIAYVTEKERPTIVKDIPKDVHNLSDTDILKLPTKKVKDGFHICYIIPLTKVQRYMIYDRLMKIIEADDGFKNIGMKNSYDTIIDISTIDRNNWMMYGSRKTLNKPYGKPYLLTHIFSYNMTEYDVDRFVEENEIDTIIRLFSVRQYEDDMCCLTKDDKKAAEKLIFQKYCDKKKIEHAKVQEYMQNDVHSGDGMTNAIPSDNISNSRRLTKQNGSPDTEIARQLTKILSVERSSNYNDWIRVGWALHNISRSLYDAFENFSQLCGDKFDRNACMKVWNEAKENGFTIASVHWWAQKDNPKEYSEIIWRSVDQLCLLVKSGTSTDIARIMYEMYKYRFKCTNVDSAHKFWYEYHGNKWNKMPGATTLRTLVTDLSCKMLQISLTNLKTIGDVTIEDQDKIRKDADESFKLSKKLKETSFLNNVVTECEHIFLDKEFEELLDCKTNLIGFKNGVYDLDAKDFREGLPEDMISLSTGYNWVDYSGDEDVFDEIREYVSSVIPNDDIREYLMRQLASYADGRLLDQSFVFWTGKGCHSGDTKIMMFDGSSKCAKDIKIGDLLMGDDSTPRRVDKLFSGIQNMYDVTLEDGTSYIVNADHRLALKSTFDGEIIFDDTSKTYIVIYHKLDNGNIVKCEKYFHVKDTTEEIAYQSAMSYLDMKHTKTNVIRKGMVIPMKLNNYLEMNGSLKEYYKNFRNVIEFEQKPVIVDPYRIGLTLGTTEIPTQYKYNSKQIRKKLLAGIIDKFGEIENNKIVLNIRIKIFMSDCIFLCRSLGYHVNVLSEDKIVIIGNFSDVPTRKLTTYITKCNVVHDLMYNFNINLIGSGRFYGFAVDQNERYVLQNFIVTYNSNGKTLFTKLIRNAFGDYYDILDHTVFTRQRGGASNATPELADKQGKRIIFMQEPEEMDRIHVGFMKQISGGDQIASRALYREIHKYTPQFKIIMVCNNLPEIVAQDEGTWRRIKVVPFESEFVTYEPERPNQFKMDKKLEGKLLRWHGQFMWLLLKKYYNVYSTEGLKEPSEVKCTTNKYRHENDIISEYIGATYEITKKTTDTIELNAFYGAFLCWFRNTNGHAKSLEKREVQNYIEKTGNYRLIEENNKKLICGLKQIENDKFTD